MVSVSPPLPFEKHAACVPRRGPSMTCLMTSRPIKKNKKKISDSSGDYKSRNSASPRIVEPSPQCLCSILAWPWYTCLNVGVPLDHPEAAMWTALLCDLLLATEIKAWRILGAVSWPSCCRKVKSRWTSGTPGGVASSHLAE